MKNHETKVDEDVYNINRSKFMSRTLVKETLEKIGEKVKLQGWVETRRDHGQLVFIELRDRSGKVQVVGGEEMGKLHHEDVIEILGTVAKRPEAMVNPKMETGPSAARLGKL